MKKNILIISILLILISCNDTRTEKFKSYVTNYHKHNVCLITETDGSITIRKDTAKNKKVFLYSWDSKGEAKLTFDSLARIHNDLKYNKVRTFIIEPLWGYCFYYDIASIDVVSDDDFDNQHLKGSSLNDIIHFVSFSFKEYINRGYVKKTNFFTEYKKVLDKYKINSYVPSVFIQEDDVLNIIDKKLSEIGTNEMVMLPLEHHGSLVFDTKPTLSKTHHLTITIHFRNGETYTGKVIKEFK